MARQPVGQGQQVLGHGGKAAHLLALRGDDAGRHPLLVHVQPAAPLVNGIHLPAPSVDGCRPAGDRRTRDFTMRALRRGGATFLDAWRSPRQFPARARSANDGRPSRRPAPPHFHPLRWPSQGHGNSGESRNPRTPNPQGRQVNPAYGQLPRCRLPAKAGIHVPSTLRYGRSTPAYRQLPRCCLSGESRNPRTPNPQGPQVKRQPTGNS